MGQTPRSRSQGHNNATHGKVLSQGIFMWNIRALALTVQKLLAMLKFQRGGQNDWMTDRTKTICPPIFDLGGIKNIVATFMTFSNCTVHLKCNYVHVHYVLLNTCR